MEMRDFFVQNLTNVKFSGESNEINRNIENIITIALWEI